MKYYKMECGCQFPIIQERDGQIPLIDYDVRNCNYKCEAVWTMLSKGLTKGVFQLESPLGKQWCKRLKPSKIEHLAALGSILRPGSLNTRDSDGISATEHYCRRKNGEEAVESIHPVVDKILSNDFSLMIFQESLMEIGKQVAGFGLVEVDELRKAVGVKDQAKLAKVGEKFITGVEKSKIISKELGELLWEDMKKSGRYSFNRCLSLYSKVLIEGQSGYSNLEDVKIGQKIYSPDGWVTIKDVMFNDRKQCYHVKFKDWGATLESLKCTLDHKVLTKNGNMFTIEEAFKSQIPIVLNGTCLPIHKLEYYANGYTMDIEVDGPTHTFFANDVAVSNSHAHAYAVNGYWSAMMKAHFPLLFFTAYLRNAYNEQKPFDEIRELINEAKLFGIEVKTPSVLNVKKHFDTDGQKIYFGLVDIKGVGDTHFEKIKNSFASGKPLCWFEFLSRHMENLGESTCEKLIKAGALDAISTISRNQMLDELSKFSLLSNTERIWVAENHTKYKTFLDLMVGLAHPKKEGGGCHNKNRLAMCLDIIKLLREPAKSLVDDTSWIAWNEKLLLGESITCSKVDGCDTTEANCTCKDFLGGKGQSGRYKDFLILAVTVTDVHEMTIKKGDKKGQQFARLIVQDNTASLSDVLVWPEVFSENSDLLFPDNVVLLMGARDKKDSFTVESIRQL